MSAPAERPPMSRSPPTRSLMGAQRGLLADPPPGWPAAADGRPRDPPDDSDANTPSVAERVPEAHVALPASPPTQAPAPDPITVRVTSGVDERERDRRANNEVDEAVPLTAMLAPARNNATAADGRKEADDNSSRKMNCPLFLMQVYCATYTSVME